MGHYTRIKFASVLRCDTPFDVVELLSAVAAGDWSRAEATAPQHEFFKTDYWGGLLRGKFAAPSWPEADGKLTFERKADGSFTLALHSSTKNYNSELEKFLAWIAPYVESLPGEVLGEYEEEFSDCPPTQFIAQAGRIDQLYAPEETDDGDLYF